MAGFKDIIGHEQIIEHLQNAIGMDSIPCVHHQWTGQIRKNDAGGGICNGFAV